MDKIRLLQNEYTTETNLKKKKELHKIIGCHIIDIERQVIQMQRQINILTKEMESLWDQRIKLGYIIEDPVSLKVKSNENTNSASTERINIPSDSPKQNTDTTVSGEVPSLLKPFSEIYVTINITVPYKWLINYTMTQLRGNNNMATFEIDLGSIPAGDIIIKDNICEYIILRMNNGTNTLMTIKLDPIMNMGMIPTKGTILKGIFKGYRTI